MDVLFRQGVPGVSTLNLYQIEGLEVYGQGGDDLLVAGALTNTSLRQIYFEGGPGNDTLDGAASTVALIADGGDGADSLVGGTGADTLRGAGGADAFLGGRGDDLLEGGSGDDRFVWMFGDGADRIVGGTESDTLQILGTTADDSLGLRVDGRRRRRPAQRRSIFYNDIEGCFRWRPRRRHSRWKQRDARHGSKR